jgi:hypothetical protein
VKLILLVTLGAFAFAHSISQTWKIRHRSLELLPHLAECVDDIALIRSMYGEHFNHEPALFLMQTGRTLPGRPTFGSWVVYGLGTENQNLPLMWFLTTQGLPINGIQNWQAGWLPPVYQGTRFPFRGVSALESEASRGVTISSRRGSTCTIETPRRIPPTMTAAHPDLDARIVSYD